jgi:hypothetical protein
MLHLLRPLGLLTRAISTAEIRLMTMLSAFATSKPVLQLLFTTLYTTQLLGWLGSCYRRACLLIDYVYHHEVSTSQIFMLIRYLADCHRAESARHHDLIVFKLVSQLSDRRHSGITAKTFVVFPVYLSSDTAGPTQGEDKPCLSLS